MVGCTDGSGEAWRSRGPRARGFVEAPIRGTHRGLRSLPTANEAGHMTASNPLHQTLHITLAGRGPSTHGLLVHREHDRVRRRGDVEADDGAQLGHERRVLAELEGPDPVRLELVRPPDPPHRAGADAGYGGHGSGRPVGGLVWRVAGRQGDDPVDRGLRQGWNTRRSGPVAQEPVHTLGREPRLPAPHTRLGDPGPAHDRVRPQAVSRRQDDLRPPDMLLPAVPVRHHRLQTGTVGGAHLDTGSLTHSREVGSSAPEGTFRQA